MNAHDRITLKLAAAMLRINAEALKESETIRGRWPKGSEKARMDYRSEIATANDLLRIARRK